MKTRSAHGKPSGAAGYATDLGMLAQEVTPDSNDLLGNFPLAISTAEPKGDAS